MQLEGTTALVTGANRGIGKALVEALITAKAGKIYACARDVSSLDRLVSQSMERVVPIQLDINDESAIQEVVASSTS